MTGDASARRRHRAGVARRLIEHRDDDARWDALSWRALEELPPWCALEEPARRELRDLAGLVSLLPALRRCLRGETLLALRSRVGEERFGALRSRPYAVDDDGVELAPPERLDGQLAERGARALAATIDEPLARELLIGALSETAVPDVPPAGRSGGTGSDGEPADGARGAVPSEAGSEPGAGGVDGTPAGEAGASSAPMSGTLGRAAVDIARELLGAGGVPPSARRAA